MKSLFTAFVIIMLFGTVACGSNANDNTAVAEPSLSPADSETAIKPVPSVIETVPALTKTATESSGWALRRELPEDNPNPEYVVLDTACGKIKGIKADGYSVYKGVRYATAERWHDAVPVAEWQGEYDATKFGAACTQFRAIYHMEDNRTNQFYYNDAAVHFPVEYSEDCLNLNIWTPDDAENLPVIVYIHGGSLVTGYNAQPEIDGEAYAMHGVILVSINYRLNAFTTVYGDGFIGNYALTDQIAALKWVRANIADYGGDSSRVTLMGESMGALCTQDLLISPMSEGLIDGAVMLSGGGDLSSLQSPVTPDMVEPVWTHIKEKYKIDSLSDMLDWRAEDVYNRWSAAYMEMPEYINTANKPIINGAVLTMNVAEAVNARLQTDVPCIIGVLSEDMYPYTLYTAAMKYGVAQSEAGKQPVYTYYFDRKLPGNNNFGAFHAGDLWYVFGTLYRNVRPFDDIDYRISDNMIDYITNFAKTGDPNGQELPQWLPVTEENQTSLRFGDDVPAMYAPSIDGLLKQQTTKPAFPY